MLLPCFFSFSGNNIEIDTTSVETCMDYTISVPESQLKSEILYLGRRFKKEKKQSIMKGRFALLFSDLAPYVPAPVVPEISFRIGKE
jgi:hypothetical protein